MKATVFLPLPLLKNLSSLASFSLVGSLEMLYMALAMTMRYRGKAYCATGKFGMDCAPTLHPAFGSVGAAGILTPSAAILVSMLSTAYMVHQIIKDMASLTHPLYFYTLVLQATSSRENSS
jgi:hypothetical protein